MPSHILITDRRRQSDLAELLTALPCGAAVLLRDYDSQDRAELAFQLRRETRSRGLMLLVAADWRLAWQIGANGVHLPERLAHRARQIRNIHPHWIVTAAAHSEAALVTAERADASAALVSPVFRTASHPDAHPLGVVRFARLVRSAALPVYALGGVTPRSARRLAKSGAVGVAGVSGLFPP